MDFLFPVPYKFFRLKRLNLRIYYYISISIKCKEKTIFMHVSASSFLITFSEIDPYYFQRRYIRNYEIRKLQEHGRVIDQFESAIKVFMECTSLLNKTSRLSKVLKREIQDLEAKKLLLPITETLSDRMKFADCNLPYSYEQDEKVGSLMRRYDAVDEKLVNLHRVLLAAEKPMFSSIYKCNRL